MPYPLKLYAYLFACFTLIKRRNRSMVQESSVLFVLVFGLSCALLAVIFIDRWLFDRKEL